MSIEEALRSSIKKCLTLDVSVEIVRNGGQPTLILQPDGFLPTYAFAIQMVRNSNSLHAEFVPGPAATGLGHQMSQVDGAGRERFEAEAQACVAAGAQLKLQLDRKPVDATNSATWPNSWTNLVLILDVAGPFAHDDQIVASWGNRLLSLIISLVPPAAAIDRDAEVAGLPEGALSRVEVNRYERNPINRANCIAALGDTCLGCGINFGAAYGEIGDGYIHVHHTVPVSKLRELGDDYRIDPVRDLVPLCPNCHAMVHRKDPPLTVDELRNILGRTQSDDTDVDLSPV